MTAALRRAWQRHGPRARAMFVPVTFAAGLVFCVVALWRLADGAAITFVVDPLHVVVAALLMPLVVTASACAWRSFLSGAGGPLLRAGDAAYQTGLVLLGKYVPGKVSGVAARVFANADRCPARVVVTATLVEQLGSLAFAALIGGALFLSADSLLWPVVAVVLGLVGSGVAPSVLAWLVSRFPWLVSVGGSESPVAPIVDAARLRIGLAWQFVIWILLSALAIVLAHMIVPDATGLAMARLAGAYAVAVVAGQVAFIFPGGIGPREGAFVWLASGIVSIDAALALALAMRIATSIVDLVAATGGMLGKPSPRPS